MDRDKEGRLQKIIDDPVEFGKWLKRPCDAIAKAQIGVDVGVPGSDHSVLAFHYRNVIHRSSFESWWQDMAFWMGRYRDLRVIVPNLERLDFLVSKGIKPSRIILSSELHNSSQITTCSIDECQIISDAQVDFIIDEFQKRR